MDNLDLSDSGLKSLPDLSALSVKRLDAKWNLISMLWEDTLPNHIEELNLESNLIINDGLLSEWPDTLRVINLSRNNLFSLDMVIHWPSNLRVLNLYKTFLTSIDCSKLPETLEELDVSFTDILTISTFPPNLKKFVAEHTAIRSLPNRCPDNLEKFVLIGTCTKVTKKTLPSYWGKSLKYLDLNSNGLLQIPNSLPDTLEYANFSSNSIREIPAIEKFPPNLRMLHLGNNRIMKIPPWFLQRRQMKFTIQNNSLTEIPNYTHCLYFFPQFVGEDYFLAAKKIQNCWRRKKIRPPMRTWRRTQIMKNELLALAMSPERAGRFEDISPEWNYVYTGP